LARIAILHDQSAKRQNRPSRHRDVAPEPCEPEADNTSDRWPDLRGRRLPDKWAGAQWTISFFAAIIPTMDKLSAMRTFVRIVEQGSLTAAADTLGTSSPTVVRTLASLERQLGVSLLKRTTRKIHLTEEGAQYLEHCRNILAAVQETEEAIATRRTEPVGRLTVTASALFGRRHVAPIVYEFLGKYPNVSADLLLLDRMVNLVEEGVDVGVRIANLKDSSLMAIRVGQARRVICASERYLERHGVPRVPADIRKHPCIRHTGLAPRGEWPFRVGNRLVSIPIESLVTCNDIDAAVKACIDGLGLGMFLSYMVAPERRDGKLKYILEKFEPEPLAVQVVYPASKLLSHRVRAFIDACVGTLRQTRFD
jgi:DNA-binding transcriptional LysR family regulator